MDNHAYVPGPGDRVRLNSPYGHLQVHSSSPHPDWFIGNGARGVVIENEKGGGLRVKFEGEPIVGVPIHWLTLANEV